MSDQWFKRSFGVELSLPKGGVNPLSLSRREKITILLEPLVAFRVRAKKEAGQPARRSLVLEGLLEYALKHLGYYDLMNQVVIPAAEYRKDKFNESQELIPTRALVGMMTKKVAMLTQQGKLPKNLPLDQQFLTELLDMYEAADFGGLTLPEFLNKEE